MVTVGTEITPRPPRRSRRALLTHRAPPSGSGVEAVDGLGMEDSDWREEAIDEPGVSLPVHERLLATSPERAQPIPAHLSKEPPQARVIAGDGEIVEVPFEHPFYPRPGFLDGIMHPSTQFHLDGP